MVTIEADVPEGYRAVAWRVPKPGEHFVHRGVVTEWVVTATEPCEFLVVEPVVKYREPTAADVGREIEFGDGRGWQTRKLLAILPESLDFRFIAESSTGPGWIWFKNARIVDDGKQVLKSREWWVNVVGDYCFGAPTKEASDALVQPSSTLEKVHVREVVE